MDSEHISLDRQGSYDDLFRKQLLPDGFGGLKRLKSLRIRICETEECLANAPAIIVFPALEELDFYALRNLRQICRGAVPEGSFGKLTSIEISICHSLEYLFPQQVVGCLTQLKRFTIQWCENMKEVIWKEQGDTHIATNGIEFPNLEFLHLEYLPKLVGFCTGIDEIDFPKLRCMHLTDFRQFKSLFDIKSSLSSDSEQNFDVGSLSLFPQKVTFPCLEDLIVQSLDNVIHMYYNEPLISAFPTLKKLEVSSCDILGYVFNSSKARRLVHLKELNISNCGDVEAVFRMEDEIEDGQERKVDTTLLPQLRKLQLSGLRKLRRLCRGPVPGGSFGELTSVEISGCNSLKYLFPLQIVGCLNQLKHLTIKGCRNMERVIWKEQGDAHIATNGIEFSNLEFLHLGYLPNLVGFGIDQIDFPKLRCMHLEDFSKRLFDIKSSLSSNSEQNFDVGKQIFDSPNASSIFPEKVTFPCLEDLSLKWLRCNGYSELQISPLLTVKKLEVSYCISLRYVFNSSMARHLVHLQELNISNCSMMDAVVDWEEEIDTTLFPLLSKLQLNDLSNLRRLCRGPVPEGSFGELNSVEIRDCNNLDLQYLPSLVGFCRGPVPEGSFGELTSIEIRECNSLEYLFPLQIVGCLTQLKRLTIQSCRNMKKVIWKEQGDTHIATNGIEFRNLEFLDLGYLPNLLGFCTEIDQIDFPNLRRMCLKDLPKRLFDIKSSLSSNSEQNFDVGKQIFDCPNASSIFPEKVTFPCLEDLILQGLHNWDDKYFSELLISSFPTVKKLEVSFFHGSRYVFHSSLAGHLVHLEELNISNCGDVEAVFRMEDEIEDGQERKVDTTLFPQLRKLHLNDLPNLKRFCHFTHTVELPMLSELDIRQCPSMKEFSLGMTAPKLFLRGISLDRGRNPDI